MDWLDDLLYLPEVMYIIIFLWLISSGPGRLSIDHWIAVRSGLLDGVSADLHDLPNRAVFFAISGGGTSGTRPRARGRVRASTPFGNRIPGDGNLGTKRSIDRSPNALAAELGGACCGSRNRAI
jgi:hypothetical protein